MMRRFVCTVAAAMLTLCLTAYAHAAEYGTAEEAKAMLERAVAAVKEDKPKALDMFQKGEGGFKGANCCEIYSEQFTRRR